MTVANPDRLALTGLSCLVHWLPRCRFARQRPRCLRPRGGRSRFVAVCGPCKAACTAGSRPMGSFSHLTRGHPQPAPAAQRRRLGAVSASRSRGAARCAGHSAAAARTSQRPLYPQRKVCVPGDQLQRLSRAIGGMHAPQPHSGAAVVTPHSPARTLLPMLLLPSPRRIPPRPPPQSRS